jgi:hypothetical protein
VAAPGTTWWLVFGLISGASLAGACDGGVAVTRRGLTLRLPDDPACAAPRAIDEVRIAVLGDFPAAEDSVEVAAPGPEPLDLPGLSPAARAVSLEARVRSASWSAGGVARVSELAELDRSSTLTPVLLAPLGRACAVAGEEAFLPPGAAWTEMGAEVLVAGGEAGGTASRRVARIGPTSRSQGIEPGMRLPRLAASLDATQGVAVVAGGAPGAVGIAHDTWEVFDPERGTFELADGALSVPRRDHGSAVLLGGEVLLVGGRRDAVAPPLGSAELIDVTTGQVAAIDGELAVGRLRPDVLPRRDGTVLVVGGEGGGGGRVPGIEWLDPRTSDGFLPVVVDEPCASLARGRAVTLPGGRFAVAGTSSGGALQLHLYRPISGPLAGPPRFACSSLLHESEERRWSDVRARALLSGSILVTGSADGEPRAALVEPGTAEVRSASPGLVAEELVRLGTGMIVELAPDAARFRREDLVTPFDNPPTLPLLDQPGAGVAFDAPGRWERVGGAFFALVEEARFDLPTLRFADVDIELELTVPEGTAPELELLLLPRGASALSLRLLRGEFGPPLCRVPRVGEGALSVRRRGDEVYVSAGGEEQRCVVEGLTDRVGIALRAARGTGVAALRLRRRGP